MEAPRQNGVYRFASASETSASFPPHVFAALAEMEKTHFWMMARRELVAEWLERRLTGDRPARVLDVGCGSGHVMACLQERGFDVAGTDAFREPLEAAAERTGAEVFQADAARLPFREEFDAALLLDVLEHVSEEARLIASVRDSLLPGGILLVTVPAMPSLWTSYDRASGHLRRYTAHRLERVLQDAGMAVERVTHFMSFLAPAALASRHIGDLVERLRGAEPVPADVLTREIKPKAPLNECWLALARTERRILRRRSLPCGTSLIAVTRRLGG
jgi:2-polyprenyl-3-methyl-5-hydroxy-6-metoxy-1,4-benzoquinol methylase